MKKIVSIALAVALLFALCACTTSRANKHVDGTLSEIFTKIYENADVESPMTVETTVDDTNKASMLGTDAVDFLEGLASEAAVGSIPHSMVLIRVDNSTDVEKVKMLIRENADPRKWICVGVEEDQVIVDSIGDLVFLVMSADATAYHNSFKMLAK